MLYDKIALDKRHNNCKIITEEVVQTRSFEQWGMLQGDARQADWSKHLATGSPWPNKQRRGRRGKEEADGNAEASAAEEVARVKEADQRAVIAEERARDAETKYETLKKRVSKEETPATGISETPLQEDAVAVTADAE